MRRQGRQEERSEEVPDQVSTGRQNPVLVVLDPTARSIGGSVADNRVEQLVVEIGDIHHEMRTLIEMLAEQRKPRQDQAPLASPTPPRPQVPLEEQQRAHVTDDPRGHVRVQRERFPRVPIRGRVGWTVKTIKVGVSDAKLRPSRACG